MNLINVSQQVEFLEDTFMHKGVPHSASVCKTDYGIAWANTTGCYLYDGQKVIDLLEKKGEPLISQDTWSVVVPKVGYFPKKLHWIV